MLANGSWFRKFFAEPCMKLWKFFLESVLKLFFVEFWKRFLKVLKTFSWSLKTFCHGCENFWPWLWKVVKKFLERLKNLLRLSKKITWLAKMLWKFLKGLSTFSKPGSQFLKNRCQGGPKSVSWSGFPKSQKKTPFLKSVKSVKFVKFVKSVKICQKVRKCEIREIRENLWNFVKKSARNPPYQRLINFRIQKKVTFFHFWA